MFERLAMSSSDRMLAPACRCGKRMQLAAPRDLPERNEAHIDVFQCTACGHEMRVTVWGEERR
jgi:Zn ribbon nucleic-acid-binding protein